MKLPKQPDYTNIPTPMGSAGICGKHGAYIGKRCPACELATQRSA